ncbi:deleted in lung and esophageal cancer protein 1 [Engraulis encrasicolus]|uniref:deleted in lung and esophageal cancer protein 1 n=1 Tax=Engraulis encrasicolus TaxID=184585 RepID=UPI002FD1B9ED
MAESLENNQNGTEIHMNRHRPASEQSQDISHIFASVFKDLYTKEVIGRDTIDNLFKSRRGDKESYHDKYVEELQKVHAEYSQRMKDVEMLERHIIQARVQATGIEERTRAQLEEEVGEVYNELGLPVQAAFVRCVDSELLKKHHLICPKDYIIEQTPLANAPQRKGASGFARPTVCSTHHSCRDPQDDGYTFIPPPPHTAEELLEVSEGTLTKTSSSDDASGDTHTPPQKPPRPREPHWRRELSAASRAEERAGLQRLRERQNFLRNPRFLPPLATRGGHSLILRGAKTERMVDGKRVAVEESPAGPVPVFLANPPVVLFTNYKEGQVYETTLELRNMTATCRHVRVIPPTTPHFSIGLGMLVFFPTSAGPFSESFTIVCDNCQVRDITIKGEAQVVAVELVSGGEERPVFGELFDVTAEHFIRFESTNPYATLRKTLVVRNNLNLDLVFEWRVMRPNLQALLPGQPPDPALIQHDVADDDGFLIMPSSGMLKPLQDTHFTVIYNPHELKEYHSVCHLVIKDVPELPQNTPAECVAVVPCPGRVCDVVAMEVEVKGSTEPYQILLEPYAILLPGETYIHTTIRRRFMMWNHSKSVIRFEWERITEGHIIEVEPPTGEIEPNECMDMELVLTGGKPDHVALNLPCHIQHHTHPIGLPIDIRFKGPTLHMSTPYLDLGLLQLGTSCCSTIELHNPTQLQATWSIVDTVSSEQDNQVLLEPCLGELAPLESCSIQVRLEGKTPGHLERVLELQVESGRRGQLRVVADVQAPQVCLARCKLHMAELYLGQPWTGCVTLCNQTLLPSHYSWGQLRGRQGSLCSVVFTPSSGSLAAHEQKDISVSFTAHTEEELSEVLAPCDVVGMAHPVVLGFYGRARTLSVSYTLPGDSTPSGDQPLVLDFGDEVLQGKPITRQLVMTNHTTIPAPFTVEAEYFIGRPPAQSSEEAESRSSYVKRPLTHIQAKKLKEKAQEDFVKSLLSHGRGAAFHIQPSCGTLGPHEAVTLNVTAHTNMWGHYTDLLICKVRDLEPTRIPLQMVVTGCPLYFQMSGPKQDDQNQGPIIRFGSHVSGGDTISRSLRLNNTSPYDIRLDWEPYNRVRSDRKLVDMLVAYGEAFPLKDADGNQVLWQQDTSSADTPRPPWGRSHGDTPRTSLSGSHTVSSECTTPSTSTKGDEERPEEEEEEMMKSMDPSAPQRNLISVLIRPHEGTPSDYPYCITPQQIVVPAGGSSSMHVSFTPLTLSGATPTHEGTCDGFALGFMSLDSKVALGVPGKVFRQQGHQVEPLRLELHAAVRPASLQVQMDEEGGALEFHAVASDLVQEDSEDTLAVGQEVRVKQEVLVVHSLLLRNTSQMALAFRLSVPPPFSVIQPRTQPRLSRTPTAHSHAHSSAESQPLTLKPQTSMQVTLAFHSSPSLLAYMGKPNSELPDSVCVQRGISGESKLRFTHHLVVEYSNSSQQTVPLVAWLSVASLQLSSSAVNFGTCYVGQTQVKELQLSTRGASCSYWNAAIDGDSSVFRVSPDCGVLRPEENTHTLELSFTPSNPENFIATVTLRGQLGEEPITLQLQGCGSRDERHMH